MKRNRSAKRPPTPAAEPPRGVSPTSAEVEAHILSLKRRHPRLVSVARAGRSVQGRPIYAVTVTDRRVSDRDKQNALVVAGQHGNEESGRMVALALLDWLTTASARETVRRQKVVVVPNVNPDGAETDSHGNVNGVHPNLDHGPGRPKTPEGKAVEAVAKRLQPEVYLDMHACGGAGCGTDMTLFPWTRPYTEDDRLLHAIAEEMCAAGERAGIPQLMHSLTWPGWGSSPEEASSTIWHYRNFKSIVLLTENTEHNVHAYPAALRARSGLAKVRALLEWGNRRHPKLYYEGYPCVLAVGMFDRGVVAAGRTAAERRAGRLAIWRNADHFKAFDLAIPQEAKRRVLMAEYAGEPIRSPVGFQICVAGRAKPRTVTLDGRRLRRSETAGYVTFTDGRSTFLMVVLPGLRPGKHEVEVTFA